LLLLLFTEWFYFYGSSINIAMQTLIIMQSWYVCLSVTTSIVSKLCKLQSQYLTDRWPQDTNFCQVRVIQKWCSQLLLL